MNDELTLFLAALGKDYEGTITFTIPELAAIRTTLTYGITVMLGKPDITAVQVSLLQSMQSALQKVEDVKDNTQLRQA